MKRKLSKKEYNEVVTKGYLWEVLDQKLDEKLDQKLDEKIGRYTGAIIEEFNSRMQVIIEYLQMVIERYDRKHEETDNKIAGQEKWLHRHEYRIGKLEGEQS